MSDVPITEYIDPAEVEPDESHLGPQQYGTDEWFNDYGVEGSDMLQLQRPDVSEFELTEGMSALEDLDLDVVAELEAFAGAYEEPVPYDYQYWLHGETEFPDNAASAPPQSGDVDPATGQVVP